MESQGPCTYMPIIGLAGCMQSVYECSALKLAAPCTAPQHDCHCLIMRSMHSAKHVSSSSVLPAGRPAVLRGVPGGDACAVRRAGGRALRRLALPELHLRCMRASRPAA